MRKTLLTSLLLSFVAVVASAQETTRCESDGRYRECQVEGRGRVTLERQLSKVACIEGDTWGFRNGRVWVDRGCRADFNVGDRSYAPGGRGSTLIVCESNGKRVNCPVDTRSGVKFARQISKSSCIEGRSWGYSRGIVWVDEGCRAEFVVGGGPLRDNRGRRQRLDQLIVCESDGKLRRCPADTRSGVELRRQISKSACEFGRDWGHDRQGVWVTNGCRAEFAVSSYDSRVDRDDYNQDDVGQLVRCESADGKRTYCRAETRRGVQLYRQISDSDCVRNRTWGYDTGGIWVSGGCRAEFELNEPR